MSCFNKLTFRAYENKNKTTYRHVISCLHDLSQRVSKVVISVDKAHLFGLTYLSLSTDINICETL